MFYERPEIQLIKALNSENPAFQPPLQPDEVAFGLPQARATDPEYNTEVDILVSQNHPTHSGSVRVQYNRWDIEKLLYRLTVPGVIGQYRNTHEALAVLVEHFNTADHQRHCQPTHWGGRQPNPLQSHHRLSGGDWGNPFVLPGIKKKRRRHKAAPFGELSYVAGCETIGRHNA